MALQREVLHALGRIRNTSTRQTVQRWLEEIEDDGKALTHAFLLGFHQLPAPVKWPGVFLVGLASPPLGFIAGAAIGSTSLLEWFIERLRDHAAVHGTLSPEHRKEMLEFLRYKHKHLPKAPAK